MKFNLDQAWNDAVGTLRSNLDVLSVLAGVFFFLPSLALTVFAPTDAIEAAAENPDRMQAAVLDFLATNWPLIALYFAATTLGTLALYALLGKGHRPTVSEALKIGVTALVPFIAASVLTVVAIILITTLLGIPGRLTGMTIISLIMAVVTIGAAAFVWTRLVLTGPIMAIEQNYNPISAMLRSWKLVKGHTRKLFLFLLLIGVALLVVLFIVSSIISLLAAAMGSGAAAMWVEAILGGILGAAISTLMLTVYVAVHQQLGGPPTETLSDTFE